MRWRSADRYPCSARSPSPTCTARKTPSEDVPSLFVATGRRGLAGYSAYTAYHPTEDVYESLAGRTSSLEDALLQGSSGDTQPGEVPDDNKLQALKGASGTDLTACWGGVQNALQPLKGASGTRKTASSSSRASSFNPSKVHLELSPGTNPAGRRRRFNPSKVHLEQSSGGGTAIGMKGFKPSKVHLEHSGSPLPAS